MSGTDPARVRALRDLITASHLMTLEQLPTAITEVTTRVGWPEVLIYLADLQQDSMYLFTGDDTAAATRTRREDGAAPTELQVDGTVAGRAFQLGEVFPASVSKPGQWWVPLLHGSERLGVLRFDVRDTGVDAAKDLGWFAGLVALLLVSKRGTSDSYARLVRRRDMNVAAEMEWRLMPPQTFATDRVLISAVMEPAYEISGDAFDYALAAQKVHLGIFDAMGHDTAAGLTANLALAAGRNHRRQGADLLQTAEGIEATLEAQFGGARYATGILAELDMPTGVLEWVNRGHHPPVIIRGGRAVVPLACPPAPPMGTGLGLRAELCRDQLEPGDRLLLYTDGITEARNRQGEEFGLERFTDFLIRHHADGLPVPETLRRLIHHHLDYHQGSLTDDATVMLLQWHGPTAFRPATLGSLVGLPSSSLSSGFLATGWTAPATREET